MRTMPNRGLRHVLPPSVLSATALKSDVAGAAGPPQRVSLTLAIITRFGRETPLHGALKDGQCGQGLPPAGQEGTCGHPGGGASAHAHQRLPLPSIVSSPANETLTAFHARR